MRDVEELASYEHFDDPDDLTDQLVDNLQYRAEEAVHDGCYDSALASIHEIFYVQRCFRSLNKYAKKLLDSQKDLQLVEDD